MTFLGFSLSTNACEAATEKNRAPGRGHAGQPALDGERRVASTLDLNGNVPDRWTLDDTM